MQGLLAMCKKGVWLPFHFLVSRAKESFCPARDNAGHFIITFLDYGSFTKNEPTQMEKNTSHGVKINVVCSSEYSVDLLFQSLAAIPRVATGHNRRYSRALALIWEQARRAIYYVISSEACGGRRWWILNCSYYTMRYILYFFKVTKQIGFLCPLEQITNPRRIAVLVLHVFTLYLATSRTLCRSLSRDSPVALSSRSSS